MTTVNTIGNFQAAGNAPGVVLLGAIIAMTSGLTGAMAIPNPGSVSNGYMRCDGTVIPNGNTVSGTPPNLSTSIFLRGATSFGGTGGGTASLVAANIPQVSTSYTPAGTVDISHTHGSSLVTGTVDATNLTHTHTYNGSVDPVADHQHTLFVVAAAGSTFYVSKTAGPGVPENATTDPAGAHGHTYSGTTAGPSPSLNHGHTFSGGSAAGQTLGTTNKSLSGTLATITVGSASPTSFNVIPNYIDVVYLIRVS